MLTTIKCPPVFDDYRLDFSLINDTALHIIGLRFKSYHSSILIRVFQNFHAEIEQAEQELRDFKRTAEQERLRAEDELCRSLNEDFKDFLHVDSSQHYGNECPICLVNDAGWRFNCCRQGICATCKTKFENSHITDCWFCRTTIRESVFEQGISRSIENEITEDLNNQLTVENKIHAIINATASNDPLVLLKSQVLRECLHESLKERRQLCLSQLQQRQASPRHNLKQKQHLNVFERLYRDGVRRFKDAFSHNAFATLDVEHSEAADQMSVIIEIERKLPLLFEHILVQKIKKRVVQHLKQKEPSTAQIETEGKQLALQHLRQGLQNFFDSNSGLPSGRIVSVTWPVCSLFPTMTVMLPNKTKSTVFKTKSVPATSVKTLDTYALERSFTSVQFNFSHFSDSVDYRLILACNINETDILVLSSQQKTDIVIKKPHAQRRTMHHYPKRTYCATFSYTTSKLLLYSCDNNNHSVGLFLADPDQGKPQELRTFRIDSRFSHEEIISGQPLIKNIVLIQDGDKAACLDLNGNLLLLDLKKEVFDHVYQRLPPNIHFDSLFFTYISQPHLLFLCYKSSTDTWIADGRIIVSEGRKDLRVFDSIGTIALGNDFEKPSFHLFKDSDHFKLVIYDSGSVRITPIKISTKSSSLELVFQDQNVESNAQGTSTLSPAIKLLPKALSKFGMSNVSFDCDPFIDEISVDRHAVIVAPTNQQALKSVFAELIQTVSREGLIHQEPFISVIPSYEAGFGIQPIPADVFLLRAIACVPMQIARFDCGTFLPLYDGHNGANWYENAVDGEAVTAQVIADNIRFGALDLEWNFFSKLPVSVVTCAGEQSSGKSTFLNHFLGSFFDVAGSRTTVGVWISFRVSSSRVWVAIDLEGLSSYERSIQQDAYQSLFGAALAQSFVLRTSMLFGRFIEQLLKSWVQAASTIPDGESLFKSVLYMTPRDVSNAAVEEVITEFSRHLQTVWQASLTTNVSNSQRQQQVHSLSLFRDTAISPFPPYARFSEYLEQLKQFFEELVEDGPRFATTTQFRTTTALLLAKLFVQDFSSVSESALKQKIETLQSNLIDALAGGAIGPKEQSAAFSCSNWNLVARPLEVEGVPILNDPVLNFVLQTDERTMAHLSMSHSKCTIQRNKDCVAISVHDLSDTGIFFAPPRQMGEVSTLKNYFFKTIADLFSAKLLTQKSKGDVKLFEEFLNALISRRHKRVMEWFEQTVGVDSNNPAFQRLRREIQSKFDLLRVAFKLCKGNCKQTAQGRTSCCNLPCSLLTGHDGDCMCLGDHKCYNNCNYCPEIPCSLGADHAGDCVCNTTEHNCTGTCCLNNFAGCQRTCSLDLNHADDCYCAVPFSSHLCTHKCSLPKCQYQCKIAHNIEHDQHDCQNAGCHEKCPLCNRLCASQDHFHCNTSNLHLCGNSHSCDRECSRPGNCEILTQLRQTEQVYKTSAGDEINYQLFSEQNAQRRRCGTSIQADETMHQGECDCENGSHYCDTRCPSCGYYCSLPIEHEGPCSCTHGNMRNSKLVSMSDRVTVGQVGTFGRGDSGIALTCTNMCRQYGRGHIHLVLSDHPSLADVPLDCKKQQSGVYEVGKQYFEVTCSAYWKFIMKFDPQFQSDEVELFETCSSTCGADHDNPSYCTLKMFHPPHQGPLPAGMSSGYVSNGHVFSCTHATSGTYHTFMIVDRSGSMSNPSAVPSQSWITQKNVLGAAIEAMSNFQQKRIAQSPND
ncbi:hypothetical protein RCL1_000857 [Eukaryota sp. TZLM3-RCL]